jgi:hypothetical protein
LSRTVAFWLVQTAVQRVVRNGVQLRATLWDGFVGSNVGFFAATSGYLVWATEGYRRARNRPKYYIL